VDEKYAGKRGECPTCGQVIMVPKVRQTTMLSVDYTTGPGYIPPRRGTVVGSSRAMRAKTIKTISRGLLAVGIIVLLIGIVLNFFGAKIPIVRNWLGYSVTIEEKEGEITSEGVATTEIEGAEEKEEGEEQVEKEQEEVEQVEKKQEEVEQVEVAQEEVEREEEKQEEEEQQQEEGED